MTDMFRVDGWTAVVTGGGGGIGATGAIALAKAGANVAIVGRTRAKLEETAHTVEAAGRKALVVEADVADESSINGAVALVTEELGAADILFNNAGITNAKAVVDLPLAEWERVVAVNLTGAYLCSKAFAPGMIAKKRGRIINMGSVLSGRGMGSRAVYAASKAGLSNFAASLAFELGPHGITVNTLGATVIVTDLNRHLVERQPEVYEKVLGRIAMGRLGQLDDLAGAIVFLASPAAAFITGQTIYVDGGYTAG